MVTTHKKRGRQPKDWVDTNTKKTINGLYRKPKSNVWRIRATGQEFTEAVEAAAIRRFFELTQGDVRTVDLPVIVEGEVKLDPSAAQYFAAPGVKPAKQPKAPAGIQIKVDEEGNVRFVREVDERSFFAAMTSLLDMKPEYCAKMTGVEWLSWHEHEKPQKADSLETIGQTYYDFCKLSSNELSRSKCFWNEFVKVGKGLNITSVDAIDHDLAHKYEAFVDGQGLSPKSKLHRYRKVRGILHFAIKRGKSIADCRKALDVLAMLEVKDAHPLDPTPISPADFWTIYGQAIKAGDSTFAALLLASLNAALYGGEAAAMKWDEIDFTTGGFVSRRSKTKVSRISIFWPETLAAIKPLGRMRDEVFCTKVRSYTVHSVADKFEKYRDDAKVNGKVTFSWIRDAAYSTAMQATDFAKAEMLAGHRLPGTADAYLRRNPQLVQQACEAIAKAFNVAAKVKELGNAAPAE